MSVALVLGMHEWLSSENSGQMPAGCAAQRGGGEGEGEMRDG